MVIGKNFLKKEKNKENSLTHNKILVNGGEILLVLIISCAFFYFCYLIRGIINPIVLFIILISALIPFWKYIWAKASIFLIVCLFTLWVIKEAGYLVAPFIWGIFIAF